MSGGARRPAVDAAMAALGELIAERRRSSMEFLRYCDISMGQIHVLAILHERGAVSVGALAEELSISAPSASAIVDRLEERELVVRERSEDDRRSVRVSLSDGGQRLTEQMHGFGAENFRRILGRLSDEDLGHVVRIAGVMREATAESREQRSSAL